MLRAAAAAALVLVSFVGVARSQPATTERAFANGATFEDATGEDPAGPDITSVRIEAKDGVLTFRIAIPNRPSLTEGMRIRVWLDSDDDVTTGLTVEGLEGLDRFLLVDRGELGFGNAGIFGCSGSTCSGGPPTRGEQTSLHFSYAGGATFAIDAREWGIERLERMRFSVEMLDGLGYDPATRRYDFTNIHREWAPAEGAYWSFDARALVARSFSATPAQPLAGRPFTLTLAAVRTNTGALARGEVSCSFRSGGRSLPPRVGGTVRGRARCSFDVPARLKGKRFRSSIAVVVGENAVARSVSGLIR